MISKDHIAALLFGLLTVVCPLSALCQAPNSPVAGANPEIRRIVDALSGTWVGQMTGSFPDGKSETFEWRTTCTPVALGSAVACKSEGTPSIGRIEESCLAAYDTESKAVHYMCATSMGEVHDHKGHWRDAQTLEFEPLRGGLTGQPITETIVWTFPDTHTRKAASTVTMADGKSMTFTFTGKRSE